MKQILLSISVGGAIEIADIPALRAHCAGARQGRLVQKSVPAELPVNPENQTAIKWCGRRIT